MPYLSWINDSELSDAVANLLTIAKNAKNNAAANFDKNVVDPFSAVFEMAGFNMDYGEWLKSEEVRKAQKTQQNHMGNFHQIILGSCKGWTNMKTGKIIDMVNPNQKIILFITAFS